MVQLLDNLITTIQWGKFPGNVIGAVVTPEDILLHDTSPIPNLACKAYHWRAYFRQLTAFKRQKIHVLAGLSTCTCPYELPQQLGWMTLHSGCRRVEFPDTVLYLLYKYNYVLT